MCISIISIVRVGCAFLIPYYNSISISMYSMFSLAACGIPDYTRRSTSLTAVAASAAQARHLECRRGDPLLRSDAVNVTPDGRVVEVGTSWFRGDSIRLAVD